MKSHLMTSKIILCTTGYSTKELVFMTTIVVILLIILFAAHKINKGQDKGLTGKIADKLAEVQTRKPEKSTQADMQANMQAKPTIRSGLGRDKCDDFSSYTDFREDDIFKPKKPSRRRNMIEPCITEEMASGEYEDHDTYNMDDLFNDKF